MKFDINVDKFVPNTTDFNPDCATEPLLNIKDMKCFFSLWRITGLHNNKYLLKVHRVTADDDVYIWDIQRWTYNYKISPTGDWIDGESETFIVIELCDLTWNRHHGLATDTDIYLSLNYRNGLPVISPNGNQYSGYFLLENCLTGNVSDFAECFSMLCEGYWAAQCGFSLYNGGSKRTNISPGGATVHSQIYDDSGNNITCSTADQYRRLGLLEICLREYDISESVLDRVSVFFSNEEIGITDMANSGTPEAWTDPPYNLRFPFWEEYTGDAYNFAFFIDRLLTSTEKDAIDAEILSGCEDAFGKYWNISGLLFATYRFITNSPNPLMRVYSVSDGGEFDIWDFNGGTTELKKTEGGSWEDYSGDTLRVVKLYDAFSDYYIEQATTGYQPSLILNAKNGWPVIRFGGHNGRHLKNTSGSFPWGMSICAAEYDHATASEYDCLIATNGWYVNTLTNGTNDFQQAVYANDAVSTNTDVGTLNQWNIYCNPLGVTTPVANGIILGNREWDTVPNREWDGDIAFAFVASGYPDEVYRLTIVDAINDVYDIFTP